MSLVLSLFLSMITATAATILLAPLLHRFAASLGLMDHPNERKIHRRSITRLGGIAIFGGMLAGSLVLFLSYPALFAHRSFFGVCGLGATLALLFGLYDDIFYFGAKRKLVTQLLLGALVYYLKFRIHVISFGPGYDIHLGWASFPVTILWIAAVMNAINLIDGMDGLAAGVSAIAFISTGLFAFSLGNPGVGMFALVSAAACIGFLRYNFSPAKIFMGDCGSMVLGFLLAIVTVSISPQGAGGLPVFVPLLLLGFPFVDTVVAIVRRVIRSMDIEATVAKSKSSKTISALKQVLSADGDHIHHRLLSKGLTQRQAAILLYSFSIVASVVSFFLIMLPATFGWLFSIVTIFGVRQMVLSLEYAEFSPRNVRQREVERRLEYILDSRPAIVRKMSA